MNSVYFNGLSTYRKVKTNAQIFKNTVFEKLGHAPTDDQEKATDMMASMMGGGVEDAVMLLRGYAGTGKSTLVAAFVMALNLMRIRSVLLAPTGRAAKVLSGYSGRNAFTVHKWIYQPVSPSEGFGSMALKRNGYSRTVFIIDESSMITDRSSDRNASSMLDDILEFVFSQPDNKLLMVGDVAQLPPVGEIRSPALSGDYLRTVYSLTIFESELKEVVRQEEGSGILLNATLVRRSILQPEPFRFDLKEMTDICVIEPQDLGEEIESVYSRFDIQDLIVVCRSNKRANLFNKQIRNSLLQRENELNAGDLLMVTRNNYFWSKQSERIGFIANGDIMEIRKVKGHHDLYGLRFADVEAEFLDYPEEPPMEVRIILDSLHTETPSMPEQAMRSFSQLVLQDYLHVHSMSASKKKVASDPFYNALQVKYAYALTCHKSQGGQWPYVVIDYGYATDHFTEENLRWLYTALTRATHKVYLFGFPDELV